MNGQDKKKSLRYECSGKMHVFSHVTMYYDINYLREIKEQIEH